MTESIASMDIDFGELTKSIFNREPQDPHSMRLEFLSDIDQNKLVNLLGYFIQYGSKHLYQKELAMLSPNELDVMQKYLHSIGYEVEYNLNRIIKEVTDYRDDGTSFIKKIPINNWQITFNVAPMPSAGAIAMGGCSHERLAH